MSATENHQLKTPRAIKSEATKRRIYDAAIQLLRDHGYQYVTINNICKSAKITVGSFYHYYESKDTLLSVFFAEAFERFRETTAIEEENHLEYVIRYLCHYCDFCEEQGLGFIREFYSSYNTSTNMMQNRKPDGTFFSPGMNEIVSRLTAERESGRFSGDPLTVANDLSVITKGCIYHWCISEGSFRISTMAERLLRGYLSSCMVNADRPFSDSE